MCTMITGVLPAAVGPGALAPHFDAGVFRFVPIRAGHLGRLLLPGERACRLSRAVCDCGTPIGRGTLPGPGGRSARNVERKVKALREEGRSEAWIDRWLSQTEAVDRKRSEEQAARDALETPTLEQWVGFLQRLLRSRATPYVGLVWERAGREVVPEPRVEIPIRRLTSETLVGMEEGVLHVFTPGRSAARASPGG